MTQFIIGSLLGIIFLLALRIGRQKKQIDEQQEKLFLIKEAWDRIGKHQIEKMIYDLEKDVKL